MTQPLKSEIQRSARAQLAMIVGTAAAAVLFYFCGYRPQTARLRDLEQTIAGSQRELAAYRTQACQVIAVNAELTRLRERLRDVKHLPPAPELGDFVTRITQLSKQAELRRLEYNLVGAPHRHDLFTEQPVSLKFRGDFRGVFEFLRQLEDLPRLTRISRLAVHGADLRDGSVEVEMSMNLYYAEG